VYKLLSGPSEDQPLGIRATPIEVVSGGLPLWLSLREQGLSGLSLEGHPINLQAQDNGAAQIIRALLKLDVRLKGQ